jgi:hypothetical protein
VTSGSTRVANAAVTIERSAGTSWAAITSTTTATDGTFAVTVTPSSSTRYRATATGAAPAYATVSVRPRITNRLSYAATQGGTKVTLATVVAPRMAGATVRLQKLVGTTWRTVASTRLGTTSAALVTVGTFATQTARYRVVLPATNTTPQSVSVSVLCRTPRR